MIVTVTPNPSLDRTLTVPHVAFDEVLRATTVQLDWGGKGFNVSRALRALGVESVAMGFVGGSTGQMLARGLGEMGIATDFVHIAGETRTNVAVAEAETERYVKVNEAGPAVQVEELTAFFDLARERVRPGDIWVLSGSLPPGVPVDFYARLVALVQGEGARALLDTSREPLRLGCAVGPYLVKPNIVEAEALTGQRVNSDAAALDAVDCFLGQGIVLVGLSLGADGLLLASKRQAVWARPPRVQALGPTGAGDALLAGIAWALERGLPLEEMARWGAASGTAAAMHEGVGVGARPEVETLYEQTQVRRINR
jgi:1-phosphofructokinase family hexose kinase